MDEFAAQPIGEEERMPCPYKRGDILDLGGQEGLIVDYIKESGEVCGYWYQGPTSGFGDVFVERGEERQLEERFQYDDTFNFSELERCNEEKAEMIRNEFEALIAKMQDISKEWE